MLFFWLLKSHSKSPCHELKNDERGWVGRWSKQLCLSQQITHEIPGIEVFLDSNLNFTVRVFTWLSSKWSSYMHQNMKNLQNKSVCLILIWEIIQHKTFSGIHIEKVLELIEQHVL